MGFNLDIWMSIISSIIIVWHDYDIDDIFPY